MDCWHIRRHEPPAFRPDTTCPRLPLPRLRTIHSAGSNSGTNSARPTEKPAQMQPAAQRASTRPSTMCVQHARRRAGPLGTLHQTLQRPCLQRGLFPTRRGDPRTTPREHCTELTPSSAIVHLCGRSGGEVGRPYPPPFLRRRALPPPSVPPAQAHYHATDADLLRSGELVDEPGSGAGPRRAYPSFHHVRPASMLRVPCMWCCRVSMVSPALALCMLLCGCA